MWYCFFPWLLYLVLICKLFLKILKSKDAEPNEIIETNHLEKYILSSFALILLTFLLWIEYQQLEKLSCKGLKKHFMSVWNVLDMLQYSSTAYITISNLPVDGSSHVK